MTRIKLIALLTALVASLAITSTAAAKGGDGGGGGGGGSCARIDSFTNDHTQTADGASVTTSWLVYNGCVDERMSSIALDTRNDLTGFSGRSVWMASYGYLGFNTYSNTWTAAFGTRVTLTLTVYSPNGKVQATQTQRVEVPAAPVL